jgi:hypothetical protein
LQLVTDSSLIRAEDWGRNMKRKENIISPMHHKMHLSRRDFLKATGMAGIMTYFPFQHVKKVLAAPSNAYESDWVAYARIAGVGLHETISDSELEITLTSLVEEGVNVIECDSSLSDYMKDDVFDMEIAFIRKVVNLAHKKRLKVVWYFPTLEVISPDGAIKANSMQKEHPDWVQRNFDRESYNFFYGTKAFWVEPNDESAWMCPNTPYKEYYIKRIELLAQTNLDGLWLDVPLFNSIVGKWPCSCSWCINLFKTQTGMSFPRKVDFTNKAFKRWLLWRHETLSDFLKEINEAARKVNPKIRCLIEVVSTDHLINTLEGLDATYFDPNLDIVWEVDAISDTSSMRDASLMDWLCMFTAFKFCRGISENRARWAFSYGFRNDDAQLVMSSLIAAQCNPYETRIPQMCTSVGSDYRTNMFHWMKDHSDVLFDSKSSAEVCLLYSPQTRDFIDGHLSGGFYVTEVPPSPELRWWVKEPEMSVIYTNYLSEYRGWASLLINNFFPFDILATNQLTETKLQQYKTVILPRAVSLSHKEIPLLLSFVSQGGKLIVTGKDTGHLDEKGEKRHNNLLMEIINRNGSGSFFKKDKEVAHGQGRIFYLNYLPGKKYLQNNSKSLKKNCRTILEKCGVFPYVEGNPGIYIQSYKLDNKTILHMIHYGWVENEDKNAFSVKVAVSIPWPDNKKIVKVVQSSPDQQQSKTIPVLRDGTHLNFTIETTINSLVIIECEP